MVKGCCQKKENLVDGTHTREPIGSPKKVCKICGCRHFEMNAEPIK